MDIIITLPANIKWNDYEIELEKVKDCNEVINFKVPNTPKVKEGDKCYIVHQGYIRGFMLIKGIINNSFQCTTTGKEWKGCFVNQ